MVSASHSSISQTLKYKWISWGSCQCKCWLSGLRFCILKKLPGDVDASGPWMTLCVTFQLHWVKQRKSYELDIGQYSRFNFQRWSTRVSHSTMLSSVWLHHIPIYRKILITLPETQASFHDSLVMKTVWWSITEWFLSLAWKIPWSFCLILIEHSLSRCFLSDPAAILRETRATGRGHA